jgi:branched-subunit amino acid transport protein
VTTLWAITLVASVGCYGLKLAGVSLPGSLLSHPGVQRIAGLLPIAMLSALVVTDLFDANRHYSANWHTLAGVGAGAIALWRGRSLIVVFLVAIAVTAALRAIV